MVPRVFPTAAGCDLQLVSSMNDVSGMPREGKNLVVVAAVSQALHFRIFDSDGKTIVDTDENSLKTKTEQIEILKRQLDRLWPPHLLTGHEKDQLVTAVTSIVGYTPAADWLAIVLRHSVRRGYSSNVLLAQDGSAPALGLDDGERVVALIHTTDGRELLLTRERVVEHGRTVIRYGDVVRWYWMTDDNIWTEGRAQEIRALKKKHFDRLILETTRRPKGSTRAVGTGLPPAVSVFPVELSGSPHERTQPGRMIVKVSLTPDYICNLPP